MHKTDFNVRNKIIVIDTLAVSVKIYNYNIFNWILNKITKLDRKTIKIMTDFRIHRQPSKVIYTPNVC